MILFYYFDIKIEENILNRLKMSEGFTLDEALTAFK